MISTGKAIGRELWWARRTLTKGLFSYTTDVLAFRAMRLFPSLGSDAERSVRLKTGVALYYRRNRGDLQSLREIFVDEVYRLPDSVGPRTILDLGANIGATSLYYLERYHVDRLIAVEPDPANATILRRNLAPYISTGVACVVQAAIGSRCRTEQFGVDTSSNLGRLGNNRAQRIIDVQVLTVESLLEYFPAGIDLVKMDIEGGEQELLTDSNEWLSRVGSMIAEFHPKVIDYPRLVTIVQEAGFNYLPAGSVWFGSMDMFVRQGGVRSYPR